MKPVDNSVDNLLISCELGGVIHPCRGGVSPLSSGVFHPPSKKVQRKLYKESSCECAILIKAGTLKPATTGFF